MHNQADASSNKNWYLKSVEIRITKNNLRFKMWNFWENIIESFQGCKTLSLEKIFRQEVYGQGELWTRPVVFGRLKSRSGVWMPSQWTVSIGRELGMKVVTVWIQGLFSRTPEFELFYSWSPSFVISFLIFALKTTNHGVLCCRLKMARLSTLLQNRTATIRTCIFALSFILNTFKTEKY